MKHLALLRHAKAVAKGGDDKSRVLADRGLEQSHTLGTRLREQSAPIDVFVSSSAARTRETAEITSSYIPNATLSLEDDLYLASDRQIINVLNLQDNQHNFIVSVGHNPGIFQCALTLSAEAISDQLEHFPTATFAQFSFDIDNWSDLRPNTGKLESVILGNTL